MKTANSFKNKRSKNTAEKAFHSACPCMQNQKAFPKKYYPYLYFCRKRIHCQAVW